MMLLIRSWLLLLVLTSFVCKESGNEKIVLDFINAYNLHPKDGLASYLSEDFKYISTSGHELTSDDLFILYNYEKIIQSKMIVKKIESSGDSVKTVQMYPDILDSLIGKPTYSDQRVYVIKDGKIKFIKVRALENNQALMDSTKNSWIKFYAWAEKEYPAETMQLQNEVQNQGATMYYLASEYYKVRKKTLSQK